MRGQRRRLAFLALAFLVALALASLLTLRPPAPLVAGQQDVVLAGVTVVNPGADRRANQRITIRGPTIASISPDAPGATSATARHYPGAYVLPGLVDLHVHHIGARAVADTQLFALLYLSHGVTAVRHPGNPDGSVLQTREQILAGAFAGPRIFTCGPILDGDPPVWPGSRVVHDAAEAERAVDEVAATGVHCIKAYQNLSADALRGIRAGATRLRLPLVGHVPFAVTLADAHLDDVQHLTGVGVIPTPVVGANPAELIVALLQSWAALDETQADLAVRTSVEQKLAHTPTIVVVDQLTRLKEYPLLLEEPEARMLPRYYREVFWRPDGLAEVANGAWPEGEAVRTNFRLVVRKLHEAGVTIHVGTDVLNPFVVPGAAMHRELRNLTACGFTPEEAWAAATRGNAAALPEPKLGLIEEGAPADLLVFREDPTRDLAALATLEATIANGRFYDKPTLDAAILRHRQKFEGWLYDRLSMLMARALAGPLTSIRARRSR